MSILRRFLARGFILSAAWGLLSGWCLPLGAQPTPSPRTTIEDVHVGFDGRYKVGFWTPVQVTLGGGQQTYTGHIELIVPDGDGIGSRVVSLPTLPVQTRPDQVTTATAYVKFGRSYPELDVRFRAGGKVRAKRTFDTAGEEYGHHFTFPLAATDELYLSLGNPVGIAAAIGRSGDEDHQVAVANLASIDRLPTRWYGYEGIDAIVLSTSRTELLRQLLASPTRVEALTEWIEMGGKLVILAGREAPEALAVDAPLANLVPGKLDRTVVLRQTVALEHYADSRDTQIDLPGRRLPYDVPVLREVGGVIEAYEGNRPEDLPLIIRAPRGFGTVVFAGVDLDQPPLSGWPGRTALLRKLLNPAVQRTVEQEEVQQGRVNTPGYHDLSGQLRSGLDNFTNVRTVPFWIVSSLVFFYIVLIGPVDYFLVKNGFKRMELTWVTFPAIVILVTVGAYWLAYHLKGDQLRINQVEMVDVDVTTGRVRGTAWWNVFSPRPDSYNLALRPTLPGGQPAPAASTLLSWMGLPGNALGGMSPSTMNPPLFSRPYTFSPDLAQMLDVPIQVWSTKTFTGRWTTHHPVPVDAALREGRERQLTGEMVNRLGVDLANCRLLYDRWLYRIPTWKDSEPLMIDDLSPRTVRTVLTGSSGIYDASAHDIPRTLDMMMFHKMAGGRTFTRLLNRYYGFCDLSGHLSLGRAILVAHATGPASQLLRDKRPLESSYDQQWTVYRFVFPVERKE